MQLIAVQECTCYILFCTKNDSNVSRFSLYSSWNYQTAKHQFITDPSRQLYLSKVDPTVSVYSSVVDVASLRRSVTSSPPAAVTV